MKVILQYQQGKTVVSVGWYSSTTQLKQPGKPASFSYAACTFMDDFLLSFHIIWTTFVKIPTFSARLLLLWDKRCTFVMWLKLNISGLWNEVPSSAFMTGNSATGASRWSCWEPDRWARPGWCASLQARLMRRVRMSTLRMTRCSRGCLPLTSIFHASSTPFSGARESP